MRVAITGGSGLIGSALVQALRWRGDEVVRIVRQEPLGPDQRRYDPATATIEAPGLDDVDAVVNLAGAPIVDARWSDQRKHEILLSRLAATRACVGALRRQGRCRRFLSGSAIGFYGDTGSAAVDESAPAGTGFLADVVKQWEAAAEPAPVPTVLLRTGHVMTPRGGYIGKQLLLFKSGLGGRMGLGTQYISWISLDDHIAGVLHLLDGDQTGPFNLTAPTPVTNLAFTEAVGHAVHRPTVLPVPLPALRIVFGSQLVSDALLASQRVLPSRLLESGFTFADTAIGPTMDRLLS